MTPTPPVPTRKPYPLGGLMFWLGFVDLLLLAGIVHRANHPEATRFELAVMFVRLYRSLDAVVGGDDNVARQWLVNPNTALEAAPLELIQSVSGLANVIQYLDARRAVV